MTFLGSVWKLWRKIMGKRTKQEFERRDRDYYATIDPDAVKPLIPFIRGLRVAEVCAGNGDLSMLLEPDVKVVWESDLDPQNKYILQKNARYLHEGDLQDCQTIVTNPPFTWKLLEPLLEHLPTLKPTWLLLPADVMHNKRMGPYMKRCRFVVSVGRLYWVENKVKGVDNYCWFKFVNEQVETVFYGRN